MCQVLVSTGAYLSPRGLPSFCPSRGRPLPVRAKAPFSKPAKFKYAATSPTYGKITSLVQFISGAGGQELGLVKIAFVTHRFLPEHRAGVEVLTDGLARAVATRGHTPLIICADKRNGSSGIAVTRSDYQGLPVLRLRFAVPREAPFLHSIYHPEVGEKVFEIFRQEHVDLVHVMNCLFLSASVIDAATRAGLPIVWTLTDYWPICWKTTLLTWDDRLCPGDWQVSPRECLACIIHETRTYKSHRLFQGVAPDHLAAILFRLGRWPAFRRHLPPLVADAVDAVCYRPERLRSLLEKVDVLVAVNPFAFEVFRRAGLPESRLRLITQTVDTSRILPTQSGNIPSSPGREGSTRLRIGFIGRINWVKGADLLVRAFMQADSDHQASLEFFGDFDDPTFESALKRLAGHHPRIRFHGSFPPEQIGTVLASLDVLVVASRWYETGPLTILEAQTARVPVICPRLGEMQRMVTHEVNGLHFERGDVDDLARQLRRIIAEPSLLERFRQNIQPIKSFDEMVREYEILYMDCLRRTTPADGWRGNRGSQG
ncbi:MAG TPA: glycosyltransferase family 4 protein [Blastocatellia bacterium]|nr:glycosyltransferase family 4 protein [Blastocatellia bacterium]